MSGCVDVKNCESFGSVDTEVCINIFNKVKEDVTVSFLPGKSGLCYNPFTVRSGRSKAVSLPYPSMWDITGSSGKKYNPLSVTAQGSNYYVVSLVPARTALKDKKYPFIPMVIILAVVIIVGFILMSVVSKASITSQCEEKGLDDSECVTEVELGSIKHKHTCVFILFIVVLFLLLAVLVAGWIFTKGPAKFSVSYNECEERGKTWKWVRPISTFKSLICRLFGGCICASDLLENSCIEQEARLDKNYKWNSQKAAMATSGNMDCFCCSANDCISVETETPTTCKQNKS